MKAIFKEKTIRLILIFSGLMTSSMILVVIAPQIFFSEFFGRELGLQLLDSELMEFLVRSWGFLISLIGVSLIIAAFNRQFRLCSMLIAGFSKLFFVFLIVFYRDLVMDGFFATMIVDCFFGVLLLVLSVSQISNDAQLKSSIGNE